MGFKWFRARLTMNREPKNTTSCAGFYRSISQFDCDVRLPDPPTPQENRIIPSIHSVPTSPSPMAFNPMAALNGPEMEKSDIQRRDNELKTQLSSDEEQGSPENGVKIPRHLPRESIELMRGSSVEPSPRQIVAKSRKTDFKKKKAMAPMPRITNVTANDNRQFVSVDKARNSDASEIEI